MSGRLRTGVRVRYLVFAGVVYALPMETNGPNGGNPVALVAAPGEMARALVVAANSGDEAELSRLVSMYGSGEALRLGGSKAVLGAVESGSLGCLRVLASVGCPMDVGGERGDPVAVVAAARGRGDCLRFLIESGCDLSRRRPGGHTALMAAVASGGGECLDLLIAAGCASTIWNVPFQGRALHGWMGLLYGGSSIWAMGGWQWAWRALRETVASIEVRPGFDWLVAWGFVFRAGRSGSSSAFWFLSLEPSGFR